MIFSLPSYRRLSEADLHRLRNDSEQRTSVRISRILFNILLLVGLWGVPLYARWVYLPDTTGTEDLPEAILGKWQATHYLLEFTPEQQVRLFRNGAMTETADYRLIGDILEVSDFKRQPGARRLPVDSQHYRIFIRDDRLIITPATTGFTPIPDKSWKEGSALRVVLPAFHGASAQFRRRDNH